MCEYFRKLFDSSCLKSWQQLLLDEFFERRALFESMLEERDAHVFTCPACGYPTMSSRGHYDTCVVCDWEDDDQDDPCADEVRGGPNRGSLTEYRINIGKALNQLAKEQGTTLSKDAELVFERLERKAQERREFHERTLEEWPCPQWSERYAGHRQEVKLCLLSKG